jgi:hypothetical protein
MEAALAMDDLEPSIGHVLNTARNGARSAGSPRNAMHDVTMLALVGVSFALTIVYAKLCDHLLALRAGDDVSP